VAVAAAARRNCSPAELAAAVYEAAAGRRSALRGD
jgi:hypothetical protein